MSRDKLNIPKTTEKLFRVILREFDDFPGRYHEYMNLVDCVVEANSKEQIHEALREMLEACKGATELSINGFGPFTTDQMISHVSKEFDGWKVSERGVAD